MSEIKDKILKDMLVEHSNALESNFEIAKRFIGITKEGKVHIQVEKKNLTGKELILLYLIGKVYAKEAEISEVDYVTNRELMEELGLKEGSVWGFISILNKENRIRQVTKGAYKIPINLIEKSLIEIGNKLDDKNE